MIYDPARRALQLRQRIMESMTAEELEEYVKSLDKSNRNRNPRNRRSQSF
jgi:hypothetical protein